MKNSTPIIESLIASAIDVYPNLVQIRNLYSTKLAEAGFEEAVNQMSYETSCGYCENILFNCEAVEGINLTVVGKDMAKAIKNGATVGSDDVSMVFTILLHGAEMAYAISPDGLCNEDSIYHVDIED